LDALNRLLKNAPAYRQAGICCVSLILALLDDVIKTFGAGNDGVFSETKNRLFSI
jgi:hypothetical protein